MKRREFIILFGAAAATRPITARAQQANMPVIGFLSSLSINDRQHIAGEFNRGLNEAGFSENQNVKIEYRFSEGNYDRLPALAADLVHLQVSVIVSATGTLTALAAKAATKTIPIVFAIGGDPVTEGLISNLYHPDGNLTGVTFFNAPLAAKRLEMLRQLAPRAATIAVLVNPRNPVSAREGQDLTPAAQTLGFEPVALTATSVSEIDRVFTDIVDRKIGALYVSADPLFVNERTTLAALATTSMVPAVYADREIAEAGGLISYGASRKEAYRQAGVYVGRILKGEKAADLPVVLPTKFEFVLNLKAVKALGLTVPPTLLALADEVIE
jgi:putative tryptophan/tyrosine transport system substrate-binding protein